tara:strand:+ start:96 stop:716 length:621 start_codon:yes stop_codon:yes gene_type:complete
MPGIKLTLPNIIQFTSIFSPYFIGTFLIFSSMLNGDVKAFFWLFFIIIVQFLGGLMRTQFGKPKSSNLNNQDSTCNIFALPTLFTNENLTYFSSSAIFHSFTILYLLLGSMYSEQGNMPGLPLIITFSIIGIMDLLYRTQIGNCDSVIDVITGTVLGMTLAIPLYLGASSLENKKYTYFGHGDINTDKIKKCNVNKKLKYICKQGL